MRAVLLLSVCVTFQSQSVVGQEKQVPKKDARAKLAINDLSEVDQDFAYQGEYLGTVFDPSCGRCVCIGLQVVAMGDGVFDGVAYAGGLPGHGWNGQDKSALSGRFETLSVSLAGMQYGVAVLGNEAQLYSQSGTFLGNIPKVNRTSPRSGAPAPPNAIVLFDGTNTDHFKAGKITEDGLLDVGTELVNTYTDFTLHTEFRLPYMPYARGQGRSNSGLYLQSRYEVQILDSFGLEGAFNECGAIYRTQKPDVNMCYPPLSWQTYDITFRSPRFDDTGQKTQNATISVCHNGVFVHYNCQLLNKTGAGKKESPEPFPIKFQNHSNPVRYRNIWIVDDSESAAPASPPAQQVATSEAI